MRACVKYYVNRYYPAALNFLMKPERENTYYIFYVLLTHYKSSAVNPAGEKSVEKFARQEHYVIY